MAGPFVLNRYEDTLTLTSLSFVDITIPSVTMANTWCEISMRAGEDDAVSNVSYYCTIELTNSTTIRIQRGGTSRDTVVEWTVHEFDSSVNVQRGTYVQNVLTKNTTITSVDLTKAISSVSYRTSSTIASNDNIQRCVVRGVLTSSTNLATDIHTIDVGSIVSWQVIEFSSDIKVTAYSDTAVIWPQNVTITAVAAMNKTFLKFSWSSNAAGLRGEDLLSCRLTTTTNVAIEDFFGGVISKNYSFYVIEYTGSGDFNVERGYDNISTTLNLVVSSVKDRSMLAVGHAYNSLIECNTSANNNFRNYGTNNKVNSDISITFQRLVSGFTATVAWELVKFAEESTPSVTLKWNHYLHMNRKRGH